MSQLNLSIATTDYDHFRDFRLGFVKAEGIEHNWLNLGHHSASRASPPTANSTCPSCRSRNSPPR
jgi:hypothetical protein